MAANFVFQFACNHLFSLPVPSVRSIPPAAELDDLAHPVGLGKPLGGQQLNPAFKIPISRRQNAQHIGDKGSIVVGSLMPVVRALLQSFVIAFLGVGNQFLNADILAHDIAGAVQEQQRQQSARAAVAVVEGMDAEEVRPSSVWTSFCIF